MTLLAARRMRSRSRGQGRALGRSLAMAALSALTSLAHAGAIAAEAPASGALEDRSGGPSGAPGEIVFAVRGLGADPHYYANFGYFSFDVERKAYGRGGVVLDRRCGACHTGPMKPPSSPSDDLGMPPWESLFGDPRTRFSRHILYDLTRPEMSPLLLAPLATEAGGYGLCRGSGSDADVFRDRGDPDYAAILESIREATRALETMTRFDMPGFRPGPEYLREMAGFGIQVSGANLGGAADVHAADRAYWRSLWHSPEASGGAPR